PVRTPGSTRTSHCARSPMARGWNASSRSTRRGSARSRSYAAARYGAPNFIICAVSGAKRRASPSAAAKIPVANASRSPGPPPPKSPKPKPNPLEHPHMAQPRTLFDKIWDSHVIAPAGEGTYLLYIDLHLIHEVTTPQAFEGLKLAGRKVRRPDAPIAVCDHNIPTSNRKARIADA